MESTQALISKQHKKKSQGKEIWSRICRNKGAMIGLFIIIFLTLIAISVDWIFDYETDVITQNYSEMLQSPSKDHWFGTDEFGRDIFSRIVYGSRFSLSVGVVAVLVALIISVPLGSIAGYFGGRVEEIIMRLTDIFSAIPAVLMAIVIVSAMGSSTFNLMLAVGIASVPQFVRVTRASVLTVRNQEYVEAARAIGKNEIYIIFYHILPNCLSPIIIQTTLYIANAIILSSSLSFLGLGVPPPAPEWGSMLSAGREFIRGYSYMTVFPGLAIMITVLAFNLLGDALRDAMDPKLRR